MIQSKFLVELALVALFCIVVSMVAHQDDVFSPLWACKSQTSSFENFSHERLPCILFTFESVDGPSCALQDRNRQGWTFCHHCNWENGQILAIDGKAKSSSNGRVTSSGCNAQSKTLRYIDIPVFLIEVSAFGVVSLFERVYDSMIQEYRTIRQDALLIFNVTSQSYGSYFDNRLHVRKEHVLASDRGRLVQAAKLLSALPFVTTEWLQQTSERGHQIVFRSVSIWTQTSSADTSVAMQQIPSIQELPSPSRPFVFLHIEKTGRSSLSAFIFESAQALEADSLVACHGNTPCTTFGLAAAAHNESVRVPSILAGHFSWTVFQELDSLWNSIGDSNFVGNGSASASSTSNDHVDAYVVQVQGSTADVTLGSSNQASKAGIVAHANLHSFSCFVMGRHPISRAISYYYQRCYIVEGCMGYQRMLNDLTIDELEIFAMHHRTYDRVANMVIDEGIGDAACRAIISEKATTGKRVGIDEINIPPPLTVKQTRLALSRISQCVVGLQEDWDATREIISHWFPWLNTITGPDEIRRLNRWVLFERETPDSLRAELVSVLQAHNKCDMLLYEKMVNLFELQLWKMELGGKK